MSEPVPPLRAVIEALLFVAPRPLSVAELHGALQRDALEEAAVQAALEELDRRFSAEAGSGLRLHCRGGRYRLRSAEDVAPFLRAISGKSEQRLSRAALECLSIVAYRQPCTRGEVERVRGVDSGGVLRSLLDRRLLRIAGRRDEPGRPIVYATSPRFLDLFGLGGLQDLPSLREFMELEAEDLDGVETDLFGDDPGLIKQVTFNEYAARQALEAVDAAVDERLAEHEMEP